MVDWVKRVENFKDNQIAEGDSIVAVGFLQPAGQIKQQAVSGGIGGLLGAFAGSKMAKKQNNQDDLTASEMTNAYPDGPTIMTLTTSGRILVYKQDPLSGKPKEFLKEYVKGDITAGAFEKGKITHSLQLSFSDGGVLGFDFPRGQDHQVFMDALS